MVVRMFDNSFEIYNLVFKRGFIPVSQFRVYEGAKPLWKIVVHVCSLVVSRDSD